MTDGGPGGTVANDHAYGAPMTVPSSERIVVVRRAV